MTNNTCRHAHWLRLGLPLYDAQQVRRCVCGTLLHDTTHLLSCRAIQGGASIRRHNDVVEILAKYIRRAGGTADVEPPSFDKDSNKRVDIDVFLGSLHLHIDVLITHPTAKTNHRHGMRELGAAIHGENLKIRKHKATADMVGATFVPYVVETFGGVAPQAHSLNRKIAGFAEEHSVLVKKEDFSMMIVAEVAAAVQYGNLRLTTKGYQQSRPAKWFQ